MASDQDIPLDSSSAASVASRSSRRWSWPRIRTIGFWVLLIVLLVVPLQFAMYYTTGHVVTARSITACLGLIGVLWCCDRFARRFGTLWWFLLAIVVLLLYFLHVFIFGLASFSGHGFDDGFFLSLHREAIAVAWGYYSKYFYFFVIGAIALCIALHAYSKRPAKPRLLTTLVTLAVSIAALAGGIRTLPAYQLATASYRWLNPAPLRVPRELLQAWAHSPLIDLQIPHKAEVHATAPSHARNLILLYVESGGVMLAPAEKYPGLAPGFQRMIHQYGFLPSIDTSSYVTIEGLVNTQCGTLIPFVQGDENEGTYGRLVPDMACLGDVLHKAGYRQVYFGGASRNFAGTGEFLSLHGYDEVVGKEDWRRRGVRPNPGSYAIEDPRLFALATTELRHLRKGAKPFNLTLFTIGTHIPGFSYPGCKPYGNAKQRYLNAVHCADTLITDWVAQLRRDGLLQNTVLVITGDHQVFRSHKMVELFGKRVLDPRLPLIVIGDDLPNAVMHSGAGYDIAPTILDLLGIHTNARFALGRSLLRNSRSVDYHVSRYADFVDGKVWFEHGEHITCDPQAKGANAGVSNGVPPLGPCARVDLQTLLDYQAAEFAHSAKGH